MTIKQFNSDEITIISTNYKRKFSNRGAVSVKLHPDIPPRISDWDIKSVIYNRRWHHLNDFFEVHLDTSPFGRVLYAQNWHYYKPTGDCTGIVVRLRPDGYYIIGEYSTPAS